MQISLPTPDWCSPPAGGRGNDCKRAVWTGRHPKKAQRDCEAASSHTLERATHHARNGQGTCHLRDACAQQGPPLWAPTAAPVGQEKAVSHRGGGARQRRFAQGAINITTLHNCPEGLGGGVGCWAAVGGTPGNKKFGSRVF